MYVAFFNNELTSSHSLPTGDLTTTLDSKIREGIFQNISIYFWLFLLIHTLIWTLGPALLRPTIPHDTLEGITWGFQWQWGYNKHPFLTAWLSALITQLVGKTGWPVYFLAQLAVSTTFIAVWKLAQQVLPLAQALIATLALEGILFYNINSFNFTPDTLQSPLWALLALFFFLSLKKQKIAYWLGAGLIAALCFCTKYQSMLLFLSMFLFCLFNPTARKSFFRSGIYCFLFLFLLLISPHLLWLYQHDFITLNYALNSASEYTKKISVLNHLSYPFNFLINGFVDVLGLFLLLWPFYSSNRIQKNLQSNFEWQILICLGLGPFALSFLLCLISGNYFPPRWSTPYFFMLGILVIGYLKPQLSQKNIKQFAYTLIIFSALLFSIRMSTLSLFPRPNSDAFLPNQKIARALSNLWQEGYHSPLPFLAGSHYLVTSIVPYFPNHPIPYLSWDKTDSDWVREKELVKRGGIFIWDAGSHYTWDKQSTLHTSLPDSILKRFPRLIKQEHLIFYRTSDHQPIEIGVGILPPQKG